MSVIKKAWLIGHKWILIDYTISPDEVIIRDKCEKYPAKDRFLIIVLYGRHSRITVQRVQGIVSEYDHVAVLTFAQYRKFLGFSQDKDLLDEYNSASQAVIDAFSDNRVKSGISLEALISIRSRALLSQKEHKDQWQEYFSRQFLGFRP